MNASDAPMSPLTPSGPPTEGSAEMLAEVVYRLHQQFAWLDDERRKDRAQLADLQKKIEDYAAPLDVLTKSWQDIEARFTRLQAQTVNMTQVEASMQQAKDEIAAMLQSFKDDQKRADQDAIHLRQLDQQRSTKILVQLDKRLTDLEREAQARLARLEQDLPKLQQTIDYIDRHVKAIITHLQALDDRGERLMKDVTQMHVLEDQLKQAQTRLTEVQNLNEHKLDQQIAKWIEELARWQKEDPHGLFERLRQQQRENQQTLLDLKELGKSLEQARSQLIHLQDTAEQRQRAAIADWQKGYEKRWSDYLAREERRREEPTKQEKALMAQIKELETLVRTQGTKLAALQQSAIEERRRRLAETEEFDQSKK